MTGQNPLVISDVPCINPGLGITEAKDLFMGTVASPHTKRAYERHTTQFIALLALRVIGEIQPGHLVAYRNYIVMDGRGASSQAQALNSIRSFLNWVATMDGALLRADQIRNLLRVPKVTVVNPYETLTKAEILRLLDVAAESGFRDYAMMLVFLGGGLRVSEVVNLACRDIRQDGDSGAYIHVRHGKGAKDRLVPVDEAVSTGVQAYLVAHKRRLGTDEPLFLAEDTRAAQRGPEAMETRSCGRRLKKLLEAAGVAKQISPHSLRHTYALACLKHGKNIMAVAKLLGHSTVATTQRYVDHLNLMEMREVVPSFLVGGA